MRKLAVLAMAAISSSCASIATWHYSDPALAQFLRNRGTHCESLPRAWSGFYFDYCWLESDPQRVYGSAPMVLLLVDGLFSGIADTVALPVTLVQQRQRGDIPLRAQPVHPPASAPAQGQPAVERLSDDVMPAEAP